MNEIEILIVEDSPDDLEMTLHALRKGNIANKVQVARDGAEALEFFFGHSDSTRRNSNVAPKVILLDLKLPKIDGIEVLKRLKSEESTRNIPVVVLTSSRENRDLYKCYNLGVNSYIVKPVSFEQFVTAVQQLGMYWLLMNQPPPDRPA